jgi:hypothetical protein
LVVPVSRSQGEGQQLYDPHIGKGSALQRDSNAIMELFKWKNGGNIAAKKLKSVRNNYLGAWIDDGGLEARYLNPNEDGGPIWNIFYLQCRRPDLYPIFDQHAYRAMIYIQEHTICGDLNENRRSFIYESYQKKYRTFVNGIRRRAPQRYNLRTIDRALYTFGRFLKTAKPFWESET